MGKGATISKARCHPDRSGVDAAGIWGEGHAPYPGRSAYLLEGAREAGRRTMGRQKSAEAKVAIAHDGERAEREKPNRHEAFDA